MGKNDLRTIMKERRAALSASIRKKEETAAMERLFALPAFQNAPVLFCYASFGSEFPTEGIAEQAKQMGKRVAYPKVDGVNLHFYIDSTLTSGYRGIPEPQGGEEVQPTAVDFLLVPGLAFTKEGYRLGYGGGFYDRYLAGLKERPFCCGIGYSCQLAENLPVESHDRKLDEIVV
ncbi:MAG: 5-formyltetrahydrofolate cyclo-ligase [Clostridia bacterium]|nr:5-formyltetrahydrofolate cyclo-ligase [Clostridia bacterium]